MPLKCVKVTEIEKQKIAGAISEVESQTSAELVVMIVGSSMRTGTVKLLVGFILASAVAAIPFSFESWYILNYWTLIKAILIFAAFFVGTQIKINWLWRALTPDHDEIAQVWNRAKVEFYEHRLHETKSRSGILIFISLLERRVVVFGDENVSSKISEKWYEGTVNEILSGIRTGGIAEGILRGINECGKVLKENFPKSGNAGNELSNHLIIKE